MHAPRDDVITAIDQDVCDKCATLDMLTLVFDLLLYQATICIALNNQYPEGPGFKSQLNPDFFQLIPMT